MAEMPTDNGIAYLIKSALHGLLTQKLITEISVDDVTSDCTVVIGKYQDEPTLVVVLIYEGFVADPHSWPHKPRQLMGPRARDVLRDTVISEPRSDFELNRRIAAGRLTVGGTEIHTRAFTIETRIAGEQATIDIDDEDVGKLCALTESRVKRAIKGAGTKINGADIIDNFGEAVTGGPYFGDMWAERIESQSLRTRRYIQLYYETRYMGSYP